MSLGVQCGPYTEVGILSQAEHENCLHAGVSTVLLLVALCSLRRHSSSFSHRPNVQVNAPTALSATVSKLVHSRPFSRPVSRQMKLRLAAS